jgi:hypothetical protein
MDTYRISKEGYLFLKRWDEQGEIPERHELYTGTIEFYGSNVVASGPGRYTRNGEDAEDVEYKAIFVEGRLTSVSQTQYSIQPSTTLPKRLLPTLLTQEERSEIKAREAESLVGKTIYVLWGGQEDGYYTTVIAEDDRELVCQAKEERKSSWGVKLSNFEIMGRFNRDTTFFDTKEEAFAHRKERSDLWESEKQEYERIIAEKKLTP